MCDLLMYVLHLGWKGIPITYFEKFSLPMRTFDFPKLGKLEGSKR